MTILRDGKKDIEILAPAGSVLGMTAAFNGGADAVYMGGSRFGARAYADNPNEDELKQAIDYAHLHHKKLYLTLNTLLKDRELEDEVYRFLNPYYKEGLDGVLVQDMGLFAMLKESFPGLPLHASTQMTITGTDMSQWLEKQGMERIVLSRELSIDEIRRIRQSTKMELEVFVQGALCYCYSGQCLMSSMIGGRSGNRGRCAQPCRLPYQADGDKRPSYLLSPKDICTLEDIPDLVDAGVNSLKIEGRMKKPEYAALTAWLYRHYVDMYLEQGRDKYRVERKDVEKLMDLYNRGGFSGGYFRQHNSESMIFRERPNHMGLMCGEVTEKGSIRAVTALRVGDVVEVRPGNGKEPVQWTLEQNVREGEIFWPDRSKKDKKGPKFTAGTKSYRMRNQALIDQIHETYVRPELKEKIYGTLRIVKGFPAILTVTLGEISHTVEGEIVEGAKNRPMAEEQLKKPILKTGSTPFVFEKLDVITDGESFIPNQQLNELRRQGMELLENSFLEQFHRVDGILPEKVISEKNISARGAVCPKLNISLSGRDTLKKGRMIRNYDEVSRVYMELHEAAGENFETARIFKEAGKEIYFALPGILREKDKKLLERYIEEAGPWTDGYLVRQMEGLLYIQKVHPEASLVLDGSIYAMNRRTKAFLKNIGKTILTAPVELNYSELLDLGCKDMELSVYGHQQLMISSQCVKKTREGCRKQPEMIQLTDRQHKHFYVYNECEFCYNRIYNGLPTMLLDKKKEILNLAPAALRLNFTMEGLEQMEAMIENYREVYIQDGQERNILKDFTRGHFTRGIE